MRGGLGHDEPKHICTGLSLPCPCGVELGEPLGPKLMVGTLGIVTISPRGAGHTGQKGGYETRTGLPGLSEGCRMGVRAVGH